MDSSLDLTNEITNIIAFALGFDNTKINPNTSLIRDLNADSLDVIEIAITLEEKYDIDIYDEDLEKLETVDDFVSTVRLLTSRERGPI